PPAGARAGRARPPGRGRGGETASTAAYRSRTLPETRGRSFRPPFARGPSLGRLHLHEAVACRGVEVEVVDLLQLGDLLQALRPERRLPVEHVQDDPLEQIAEGEVVVLGQGLEDFDEALFHA